MHVLHLLQGSDTQTPFLREKWQMDDILLGQQVRFHHAAPCIEAFIFFSRLIRGPHCLQDPSASQNSQGRCYSLSQTSVSASYNS